MHPTATVWPTLKRETLAPTAVTRPTISCPGTHGYTVKPHSLRAKCRSLWHTPQNKTSSATSVGPGSRRWMESGPSGEVAAGAAYAAWVVGIVRPCAGVILTLGASDRRAARYPAAMLQSCMQVGLLLMLGLCLSPAGGCAGPPARRSANEVPMSLVYLVTGPRSASHTPEEKQQIFAGHMANMQRLAAERKLLIAGPFGQPRDKSWRGILVLDAATPEEARGLASTDPGVISEEFSIEVRRISAPRAIRESPRLEEAQRARLARETQEGATPPSAPGSLPPGLRRYVMMHATDLERAKIAIAKAKAPRVIWAVSFLDGAGGVLVLDAEDPDAVSTALTGVDAGEFGLDRWLSTRSLEGLAAPER